MSEHDWWEFEIIQGGMAVASGCGADRHSILSAGIHYLSLYEHDGPCLIKFGRAPLDTAVLVDGEGYPK